MEPSLAALLRRIRARPKAPRPDPERLELAQRLSSAPLADFAYALASHLWGVDFGRFEATAEPLADDAFAEDIVAALGKLGHVGAEAIVIGTTGGGDEALLMIADDRRAGGYLLATFAYDGSPYPSGEDLEEVGWFADLLRRLLEAGEIGAELRAVLAAAEQASGA